MLVNAINSKALCRRIHIHTSLHRISALRAGFRAGDLLRVGYATSDVVEVAPDASQLHAAGMSLSDLARAGLPPHLQGIPGLKRLRQGGYTARDVLSSGLATPWAAREAGYALEEVAAAGVSRDELRAAGFAPPQLQPPAFLGQSVAKLQACDPRQQPDLLEGTQTPMWRALTGTPATAHGLKGRSTGGGVSAAMSGTTQGGTRISAAMSSAPRPDTAMSMAPASAGMATAMSAATAGMGAMQLQKTGSGRSVASNVTAAPAGSNAGS